MKAAARGKRSNDAWVRNRVDEFNLMCETSLTVEQIRSMPAKDIIAYLTLLQEKKKEEQKKIKEAQSKAKSKGRRR